MILDLTSLTLAVRSMEAAVSEATSEAFIGTLTGAQRDLVRAGVIQNFEFTYEMCWKFMKRRLAEDLGATRVDGIPRRELFRLAAEHLLIDDVASWFRYHTARNLTAHTYNADTADEVFRVVRAFVSDARAFLTALETRNG